MNAHIVEKLVNGICLDWFEFTIFNKNYFEVIDFIGLLDEHIEFITGFGQYGYSSAVVFNGITVLFNGRDDMGIHVRMTGTGCRTFEKYSKITFDTLIELLTGLDADFKMSRLDVAYDDYEGLLDMDLLIDDVRSGNVVSRMRKGTIIEGFSFDGTAKTDITLNCGRQNSNIWITIYDKLAERKSKDIVPEDCTHWVRCEIKMRHQNADRFIQLLQEGKKLGELYFLVLNNYVRFVVPSETDKNRWRWALAPHWERFCNSVISDCISLYVAPSDEYDEYKLMKYVIGQAGAAVYTYIQKFSINDLMKQVENKKYKLQLKYRELLADPEEVPEDE